MNSKFALLLVMVIVATPRQGAAQDCPYVVGEEDVSWEHVEDGIEYGVFSDRGDTKKQIEPVHVHLLKVDLSQGGLTLRSLRPLGRSQRIEQIVNTFRTGGVDVRGAINGDYFSFLEREKDPLGLHVSGGQVLRFPAKTTSLVVDSDNTLHMDRYELEQMVEGEGFSVKVTGANTVAEKDAASLYSGYYQEKTEAQVGCAGLLLRRDSLEAMVNGRIKVTVDQYFPARKVTSLEPLDLALVACGTGVEALKTAQPGAELTIRTRAKGFKGIMVEAISGGPRILRDGKVSIETDKEGFSLPLKLYIPSRHPRSAVARSADGKTAFLLVAEGRMKRSAGLTAGETACILSQVGASDAMLFDGGGSVVLMGADKFYNLPHSKRTWTARDLANALAVIRRPSAGD